MNPSPYDPPKAIVGDNPEAGALVKKAPQIVLATRLLWAVLGLGVINSALQWRFLTAMVSVGLVLSIQLLSFAVLAWLTSKVAGGRNWARITYMVMAVIGLP